MKNIKTYVLDTNVLLSDPNSIFSFDDNNIIIPLVVLEELDNHKSRQDEVGKNARIVSRKLDELREKGSLLNGIRLHSGGFLSVVSIKNNSIYLPLDLQNNDFKVDNLIIAFMLSLRNEEDVILISKDINVRLKCDSLGIPCEDYMKMRVTEPDSLYKGVEVVTLHSEKISSLFSQTSKNKTFYVEKNEVEKNFFQNQIVVFKSEIKSSSLISRFIREEDEEYLFKRIYDYEEVFGLKPRNKEQNFSLDLLFDDNVKLLTLVGPSGTGKTLLAISAALEQIKGLGRYEKYDKLIVTRPVQPLGKDIGFLPGTLEEKMEPWIAPIRDNINFLMNSSSSKKKSSKYPSEEKYKHISLLQDRGLLEIEAITFIRGRSIPNAFIIIDEAQNLSMHELKTIITRVGEGTKIVLTGDIEQIDNIHVDVYSNGLTYAVEKFKDQSISGHVTLIKGERSELATIASKIL